MDPNNPESPDEKAPVEISPPKTETPIEKKPTTEATTEDLVEEENPFGIPPRIKPIPGTLKLPGFIDVHVHIREPNEPFKENFDSGTSAALAGGITMICVMPNTSPPITDEPSLNLFQIYAQSTARCDYALYVAATDIHCPYNCEFASAAAGLKIFVQDSPCCAIELPHRNCLKSCSLTLNNMSSWKKHLQYWPKRAPGPIVCHAEKSKIASMILFAYIVNRHIHICHVSKKEEIMIIRFAKDRGIKVTCEVCPHHLFLTIDDIERIGEKYATVKPSLGTAEDQKALWDNINYIDIFTTDHSATTKKEKTFTISQPGFPGLETILPLLLNAVNEGRLTIDDIITKFHKNPIKIFNLPVQPNTYIEVKMDEEWVIPEQMPFSKSKWTPYAGMKIKGKLYRVILRGQEAFYEGKVLVDQGFGKDVRNKCYSHWKQCMK